MTGPLALVILLAGAPDVTRDDVLVNTAVGGAIGAAGPAALAACGACAFQNGDSNTGAGALGCALLSYGCTSSGGAAIGAWKATRDRDGGEGALIGAAVGTGLGVLGTATLIGGSFFAFTNSFGGPIACGGGLIMLSAAPVGVCMSTLMTDEVAPRTKREVAPPAVNEDGEAPPAFKRPPPPPLLDEMHF